MEYNLQVQKLLLKRDALSSPNDRIALLKQAINLTDVNSDPEWGFELRLELIREEKGTSRCNDSLPAFTWILDAFEKYPEIFDESDFLWEYKWMLGSVRRNSSIPMEQIDLIAEDFKMRLQRNGYSLRPYYTVKAHMALFLSQLDDAKKYLELRNAESRDEMSNCRACELDDDVELELRLGNFDKALNVGKEMLEKKVVCGHMPFVCYCSCVKYFHRAGNMDKAHEFFNKAIKDLSELEYDTSPVSDVAKMLRFLIDYDRNKAWAFFEQYAHWNIGSEDFLDYEFSKSVLPLLAEGGEKTLTVNSAVEWYRADNLYDLQYLYNYYYTRAKNLADRFDRRNGSDVFNKQLEEEII
ncbi:MAG: hypothetical protein LBG92_02995 [Prevotellaceae bacterium]|jgi:hypothetical protein|nr:hypothetical protein [Prevotellaceae bacterium]